MYVIKKYTFTYSIVIQLRKEEYFMEIIVWSSVLLYAGIYTSADVKERISNVFN